MDSDDVFYDHDDQSNSLPYSVSMAMRSLQTRRSEIPEIGEEDFTAALEEQPRFPDRRSVSPEGSHYSQDVSSSSAYEEEDEEEEEDDDKDGTVSPHQRPFSPTNSGRPLRVPKLSAPFHLSYLSLLNDDILDASTHHIPEDPNVSDPEFPPLTPSQIGLTYWSAPEKSLFFSALSRLGPDNALGISCRVRTKSELEVSAYISLLKTASAQHSRSNVGANSTLPISSIPSAAALSPALCSALESCADTTASKQAHHEESLESARWGEEAWLITPQNRKEIELFRPEGMLSLDLFRVRTWLRLQERVFMNSTVEDYQWQTFSDERPGIRTTCLEDFYSLVVSITRRLVAASIYVTESRIKSKKDSKNIVWPKDVRAAVASVGLEKDSREFWAECARRLRLDVWDETEKREMKWAEVEKALGLNSPDQQLETAKEDFSEREEEGDNGDEDDIDIDSSSSEIEPSDDENDRQAVKAEYDELIHHSALEFPELKKDRDALRARIQLERAEESYADKLDAKSSYNEEKRLWAMLGQTPPVEIPKVEVPERNPRWAKRKVGDMIRGFSRDPAGDGDWRSKLDQVPSRWEMEFELLEEERVRKKARMEMKE